MDVPNIVRSVIIGGALLPLSLSVSGTLNSTSRSLDALADALGLSSKSTIHAMIHRLKDGGWVTMQPNRWRTVMSTRNSPFKKVEKTIDESVKI